MKCRTGKAAFVLLLAGGTVRPFAWERAAGASGRRPALADGYFPVR
ncbi:hypothetical protein [Alistipes senegalensis]|nr:hypothetical protein [Alistipes senegalensis]